MDEDQDKGGKNILTSPKLRMSAPNPNHPGKRASFSVEDWNGNPRFVLRTGNPAEANDESGWGIISAPIDLPTLYAAIEYIRDLLQSEPDKEAGFKIEISGGKPKEGIVHQADVIFGKTAEGMFYASVIDKTKNRDKIRVPFGPPDERYVKFINRSTGAATTPIELSRVYARAWINMLSELAAIISAKNYVPFKPNFEGQDGEKKFSGGNGNQNRQGGGGNYNRGTGGGYGGGGGYQRGNGGYQRGNGGGGYHRNGGGGGYARSGASGGDRQGQESTKSTDAGIGDDSDMEF